MCHLPKVMKYPPAPNRPMVSEWYKIHKKKGSWNFEGEFV